MENQIKVNAPEGYVIDTSRSTSTEVFFKPIEQEKKLPMSWENLQKVEGWYVNNLAHLQEFIGFALNQNRSTFPTLEEAEASVALAQLLQLRNSWNGFHIINSPNDEDTFAIRANDSVSLVFCFKSQATRDLFQKTFADLIQKASPLL